MPGMDIFVTNAARPGLEQNLKRELLSYSSLKMPHVANGHHGVFTLLVSLVLKGGKKGSSLTIDTKSVFRVVGLCFVHFFVMPTPGSPIAKRGKLF
jgi:hypothetical protein